MSFTPKSDVTLPPHASCRGGAAEPEHEVAAVFSPGIRRIRHLEALLSVRRCAFAPRDGAEVDYVVTWGRKATGRRAAAFARKHDLPLVYLEDGFFRSVQPGSGEAPLSLIHDDLGIYYDATRASRLEQILTDPGPVGPPALLERAERAIDFVKRERLSKYNHGSMRLPDALRGERSRVLLVDQTHHDASLRYGMVPADAQQRVIERVRREHPGCEVVLKTHPDVLAGRRKSFFLSGGLSGRDVTLLREPTNPLLVLERVDHVVTASSQMGFEALLLGKPVTCLGAPFYAGWGLTHDDIALPRRGRARSLVELVAAAWFLYPRYVHPVYGSPCSPEEALELLAHQRRRFAQNAGSVVAVGFSPWKRRAARRFLGGPDTELRFVSRKRLRAEGRSGALEGKVVAVWGQLAETGLTAELRAAGIPLRRVEDGFLRSARLGSDLTEPASLIVDHTGMYYDPSSASDLERRLLETCPTQQQLERARALLRVLIEAGLSKYNVQTQAAPSLSPGTRPVVLVVGQVEGDASVRAGGGQIQRPAELVRAVRAARPDAFLLYKPHPDVLAGNRPGALRAEDEALVDHVEKDASGLACVSVAQEVHTITSLLGFEALLRGAPVWTYGLPFYAGWGLTHDTMKLPRRNRTLSLDELVREALVQYPLYVSPTTGYHVGPEEVAFELQKSRDQRGPEHVRSGVARQLGRALRYVRGWLGAR